MVWWFLDVGINSFLPEFTNVECVKCVIVATKGGVVNARISGCFWCISRIVNHRDGGDERGPCDCSWDGKLSFM